MNPVIPNPSLAGILAKSFPIWQLESLELNAMAEQPALRQKLVQAPNALELQALIVEFVCLLVRRG